MVTKLTLETFEPEVVQDLVPVLVDFYADWCAPCKMLAPLVEKAAERFGSRIKVCKANVDEVFPIAAHFGVQSIPTLILFRNGEIVKRSVGLCSEEELELMIRSELSDR